MGTINTAAVEVGEPIAFAAVTRASFLYMQHALAVSTGTHIFTRTNEFG